MLDHARLDFTIPWKTWPDVWHLDHAGRLRCWHKASSIDSITLWAEDHEDLLEIRRTGVAQGG